AQLVSISGLEEQPNPAQFKFQRPIRPSPNPSSPISGPVQRRQPSTNSSDPFGPVRIPAAQSSSAGPIRPVTARPNSSSNFYFLIIFVLQNRPPNFPN
ncbi:hypothetical protein CRG98_049771, partial [Punica granatum]